MFDIKINNRYYYRVLKERNKYKVTEKSNKVF